jgi:hypothetical protein
MRCSTAEDVSRSQTPEPEVFTPAPHLIASGEASSSVGIVLNLEGTGESSFRVWAPHAASAFILLKVSPPHTSLSQFTLLKHQGPLLYLPFFIAYTTFVRLLKTNVQDVLARLGKGGNAY